jgi:hypothetical protein
LSIQLPLSDDCDRVSPSAQKAAPEAEALEGTFAGSIPANAF